MSFSDLGSFALLKFDRLPDAVCGDSTVAANPPKLCQRQISGVSQAAGCGALADPRGFAEIRSCKLIAQKQTPDVPERGIRSFQLRHRASPH